ncbi:protein NEOXANTHIN-DEFICIENT 1 [Amaranthus tricolor]|uniref:protein NEOXANTHIN-DEFICIENT 1 n=1 Tax=Amaranthus tricolor TaxID=29722 RepID=UPI00258F7B2E|nr:protein NEOXANTHIN-DEFICIENT 1 [Amaranthus tricolor]XP_057530125.1 protein NEOXANTHIN-DEFICIENT 1 [Amaranthus tricolor]XP_057530126.1 protein NEOXANTHIN-DEFICIENT 1 [Amaranthus tricolor]
MEVAAETKTTTGYGKPPWRFTGRAVYQLHLVKSEVARALIPKDFRLVEAFGYTLGGFFLANYDHSPAGVFDELVVIAGIVWNPPTSCAWASKVLVNSNEACFHGRREVGLPSHVARFTKRLAADTGRRESRVNRFLNMIGFGPATAGLRFRMDTQVTKITVPTPVTEEFSINLLSPAPEENSKMWLGPRIKLSLPSFSGRTEYNPNLLKYSCQMECRVRVIRPLKIFRSSPTTDIGAEEQAVENQNSSSTNQAMEKTKDYRRRLSLSVMLSNPILALEFNCMNMNVENPLIISQ